jgi:hypothetical protein
VNPQVTATPVPGASATPAAPAATTVPAVPAARNSFSAIPRPSLKPGEVITWVKLDRPKLALGEIIVGSFALAGLVMVVSMAAGVVLGHFRSKRAGAHGTQSLGLR